MTERVHRLMISNALPAHDSRAGFWPDCDGKVAGKLGLRDFLRIKSRVQYGWDVGGLSDQVRVMRWMQEVWRGAVNVRVHRCVRHTLSTQYHLTAAMKNSKIDSGTLRTAGTTLPASLENEGACHQATREPRRSLNVESTMSR